MVDQLLAHLNKNRPMGSKGSKSSNNSIGSAAPLYFYLSWETKKADWTPSVQASEFKYELLVADTASSEKISSHPELVQDLTRNLTQGICRSNTYLTIVSASQLICKGHIQDLLKTLQTCAVYHSLPLNGYTMITWFLKACPHYNLCQEQLEWVLGYAYDLAACKFYILPRENSKNLRLEWLVEGSDLVKTLFLDYPAMASMWANFFHTQSVFLKYLHRKNKYITCSKMTRLTPYSTAGLNKKVLNV